MTGAMALALLEAAAQDADLLQEDLALLLDFLRLRAELAELLLAHAVDCERREELWYLSDEAVLDC
jgi:hypothetical protein